MIINRDQLKEITGVSYYDGAILHDLFAYKFFKDKVTAIGNIITFRAPMEVTTNLIDLEDSINKDYIYSDDAINICIEIPHLCLTGGIAFQRLYNTNLANILHKYISKNIIVDGDDILVEPTQESKNKCSVSIAGWKNNHVLIHTAINIDAGKKAPTFAYSTELTDEQANEFMQECINLFYSLAHDIHIASRKVVI